MGSGLNQLVVDSVQKSCSGRFSPLIGPHRQTKLQWSDGHVETHLISISGQRQRSDIDARFKAMDFISNVSKDLT